MVFFSRNKEISTRYLKKRAKHLIDDEPTSYVGIPIESAKRKGRGMLVVKGTLGQGSTGYSIMMEKGKTYASIQHEVTVDAWSPNIKFVRGYRLTRQQLKETKRYTIRRGAWNRRDREKAKEIMDIIDSAINPRQ